MKRIFSLAALLLLGACACQGHGPVAQGYVGRPASDIVAHYGWPSAAYDMSTTDRAFVIGKDSAGKPRKHSGLFKAKALNTHPGADSFNCVYVMYAHRTRDNVRSPTGWTVTSFQMPNAMCK
jgi:hypothetical protein